VLSTVQPEIALEIFDKDCLIRLGTCIAPSWNEQVTEGEKVLQITGKMPGGEQLEEEFCSGELNIIPLKPRQEVELELTPTKKCGVGAKPGEAVLTSVEGGEVGIIVDTRGRPIQLPQEDNARKKTLIDWYRKMKAYPKSYLEG
jgi:hypothetical protein